MVPQSEIGNWLMQHNPKHKPFMKNLLLTLIVLCSFALTTHAEISPEKRQEIEKMLRLTGMEKLVTQMKQQMISGFEQEMPNVPTEFWSRFEKKMDVHELIEKIIPVYDKYYTIDDLKAVNAFYETPTGQKVLANMPQVVKESMEIGREWGEKIGKEAAAEAEQDLKKKKE